MKYEKIKEVYACCGQYIARSSSVEKAKITCPRCERVLDAPIKCPSIVVVKK